MKAQSALFLKLCLLSTLIYFGDCKAQNFIEGNWTARCVIEKTSQASVSFNSFCQYEKLDQASMRFIDFGVNITDQVLSIEVDDEFSPFQYTFDEGLNVLTFNYNNEDFKFNVLVVNGIENLLLRDESGSLVYLEKKS